MQKIIKAGLILAPALLAAYLTTEQGAAAATKNNYTVLGAGSVSCPKWNADRQNAPEHGGSASYEPKPDRFAEEAWVMGFVTSYNAFVWKKQNVASKMDEDARLFWLENYCSNHPTSTLANAAERLVEFMSVIARPDPRH
jgi:hypothetical protein